MIRLSNITKVLQAVLAGAITTSQPQAVVSFFDENVQGEDTRGADQENNLNSSTDVTICSALGTGKEGFTRNIDTLTIYNRDTASVTVTVKIDDATVETILVKATLATAETLGYDHESGWWVQTAAGARKTASGSLALDDLTDVTITSVATGDYLMYNGSAWVNMDAYASVAAHATTMDPWVARVILMSGSAVTFTDIADADYIGQEVLLLANAAHIWTNGAVFDVQGNANYTCSAGDQVLLVATAIDAFDVTIFKADGTAVVGGVSASPITASLGSNVALNNTGTYFDGPTVAQGSTGTWFVSGTITAADSSAAANIDIKLWDGTTVIASTTMSTFAAGARGSLGLSGYIVSPAGNLRISAKDTSSTNGSLLYDATGNAKDCTITAIRIA